MEFIEKKISYYLRGRGLDTSRIPVLKGYRGVEVSLVFKEPDSLYHFYPEDGVEYESFDFVFNNGLFTETKFYKILIKEWFYLIKVGGNLVVRFKESLFINRDNIGNLFESLVGDAGEILYINKDEEDYFTVIIQKINSIIKDNDDITKWSFCIINPKGLDASDLIRSIEYQKIPQYEIILDNLAEWQSPVGAEVKVVSYGDGFVSTAVMKNKMLLSARYENVVIIDRSKADIILSEDWYKQAKRYGNYFEALSCVIATRNGERCADWLTLACDKRSVSESIFRTSMMGLLEYRDWNDWVYFPNPVCILKKSLYHKALWDNYSAEGDENTLFSHQLHSNGAILRVNPELLCRINNCTPEFLARNFPYFEYDRLRLGKRKGKLLRRMVWLATEVAVKMYEPEKFLKVAKVFKSSWFYRILVK